MKRRVLVPVDLGGSPTRCRLSPPRDPPPTPELVEALVAHYRARHPGRSVEVAFFRGGLPGPELLAAAAPHPVRVACNPADLDPGAARRLRAAGVRTVEAEVLTFDRDVRRDLRRGGDDPRPLLRGLARLGFRVGVTLAPGLPGGSHAAAVADARELVDLGCVDFARITPALAWEGSDLARLAAEGRWTPMTVEQAVTTAMAMLDVLDAGGIPVIRLGIQPGQDVPRRATAGPVHPNLRQLVEARRFRRRMAEALIPLGPGRHAVLRVNPRDLSWARGTSNDNVRALRARLRLRELRLEADETVARGQVELG